MKNTNKSNKTLRSTVLRPQSVRIRDLKPPTQQNLLPSSLLPSKPPPSKLIIQFSVPQKILKTSSQPFLWQQLTLQNTQLKNIIHQLKLQNQQLNDTIKHLKQEMKKVIKMSQEEQDYNDQELSREKQKYKNFKNSLSNLRLKESELKYQIQLYEEDRKSTKEEWLMMKGKQSQLGETKMKLYEVKEENRFLNKKISDDFKEMIQRKYPHYSSTIFQSLNIFKRLEKLETLPPNHKLNHLIAFTLKPLYHMFKKLSTTTLDWIKYSFFGKHAYHPSNSDLIQAMLDKWRNSDKLVQELDDKTKKLIKMEGNSERMLETIRKHEEYISQLEIGYQNVRFRNERLEEVFEARVKEFGGGLVAKLKRYEEEMRVSEEYRDKEYGELSVLVNPEYVKLKEIIGLIEERIYSRRQQRANNTSQGEQHDKLLLEQKPNYDHEINELKQLTMKTKQRRDVVILKKNVYGYWIDPNFTSTFKRSKKPYQKYHHKSTQTNPYPQSPHSSPNRLFFSILLLQAKFRSISLSLDPYVKFTYSSNTYISSLRSGKTPEWNETFTFQQKQTSMSLTIYDKQKLRRDEIIGECTASFVRVFQENSAQQIRMELQVKDRKGEFIGTLWIGVWMLGRQEVIHVREIEGNFKKQKDVFSEMDPYCVFGVDGGRREKTGVCRKGGAKPIWREDIMVYVDGRGKGKSKEGDEWFEVEVKDEDVLVDDMIGVGKIALGQIPDEQETMVMDLTEEGEEDTIGTLKFKIYKHTYVNPNIKQKQPILIPLSISPSKFFILQSLKISTLKSLLPLSLFFTASYSNSLKTSSIMKGKQLFYPQPFIFKISDETIIKFQVFQKTAFDNVKEVLKLEYDGKENMENNYSDVESVRGEAKEVEFGGRFRMLESTQGVYLREMRVEMVKQMGSKLKLEVKIDQIGTVYDLVEESGYLQAVLTPESSQLYSPNSYSSISFRLLDSSSSELAKSLLPKSSILPEFYTQLSTLLLSSKSSTLIAQLTLLISRYKHTTPLKLKLKKPTLEVENREYFSLFAHKALLTRSTELIGEMNCYLMIEYVKEWETKCSKGGKKPVWNQSFVMYYDEKKEFRYKVMDKESVLKDDLVGSGGLDLNTIVKSSDDSQFDSIIGDLSYQSSNCGSVFFSLVPIPSQTVIFISLLRAQIHQDTDWFNKIDPYAIFSHNKQEVYKTSVLDNKGQNPEWKLGVQIEVVEGQTTLEIKLYDEDVVKDDYLGVAEFDIREIKEEYEEISASLMKDGKKYGVVYLTAAKRNFVNMRARNRPAKIPKIFSNLKHLFRFTILQLTTKQPQKYLIKYQYPFSKQIASSSQSLNQYYNFQQHLSLSTNLISLQFHKPHLLQGYQHKYTLKLDPHTQFPFQISQLPLLNSKSKNIGTLRYVIEDVYKCWVVAVSRIKLVRLDRELENNVRITFRTTIDSYDVEWEKAEGVMVKKEEFWVYCEGEEMKVEVGEKSKWSEEVMGRGVVQIRGVMMEELRWVEVEVEGFGVIAVECAKMGYQKPFNFTCRDVRGETKCYEVKVERYLMEGQKNKDHKNGEWIGNDKGSWKVQFKEDKVVAIIDEQQSTEINSSSYEIQNDNKLNLQKPNGYMFLKHKKQRVGIVTYQLLPLPSYNPQQKNNQNTIKLVFKNFRIKYEPGSSSISIKSSERQYNLANKIGEYWYCQKMTGFAFENQKYFVQVTAERSQEPLKIQLEYKQQCYFQNEIKSPDYTIYYSVEAYACISSIPHTPCLPSPPTITNLQLFSITSLSFQTPNRTIGSGFLFLSYNNKNYTYNILNSQSLYQIPSNNTIAFQRQHQNNILEIDIQCKLKGKARVNIDRFLRTEALNERVMEGEIVANNVVVGVVKMKLKYQREFGYKIVRLERMFVAREFEGDVKLRVECGKERNEVKLKLQQGIMQQKQKPLDIILLSKDIIRVYAQSNGKVIGQSILPSPQFNLALESSQLNVFISGQTYPITNTLPYSLQQQTQQRAKQTKQFFSFTIKQVYIQDCSNDIIFFSVISQSVFYSPFYEVNKHNYSKCQFSFLIPKSNNKLRLEVWKREMGGDKLLGESTLASLFPKQKTLQFTIKNNVSAIAAINILPYHIDQYYQIHKINASQLRDTELLVEMKPYILIECGKYSYRTNIGVGKEKLNWIIGGALIIERKEKGVEKLKITVMDRDLKYDDQVGIVEMEVGELEGKEKGRGEWKLRHKGKVAGKIEVHSEKVENGWGVKKIEGVIENKEVAQVDYFSLKIFQISNVSNKLISLNPYLKITSTQTLPKHQTPISTLPNTLLFNATHHFNHALSSSIKLQLCSKINKAQKIHSHLTLPLQQTDKTQTPLTSETNQTQQLTYEISPIEQRYLKVQDVKMFLPGSNPQHKKSLIVVTESQYYRSREINSSDNKVCFYDDIYLYPFGSACALIYVNGKLIGRSTLNFNRLALNQTYLTLQIVNLKHQNKGLLEINYSHSQPYPSSPYLPSPSSKTWYILTIHSAKMTRDVQLLSKMDLYCLIQSDKNKYQTRVLDDIGMFAQWNETLVVEQEEKYTIGVWDSEVIKDRVVGSGNVVFGEYKEREKSSVEVMYKEKSAGNIVFSYYSLKTYVRLNNFSRVSEGSKIEKLAVQCGDQECYSGKDFAQIERFVIEVPLVSDKLKIKLNDKQTLFDFKELMQKQIHSCVIDEFLYFEYRIFS